MEAINEERPPGALTGSVEQIESGPSQRRIGIVRLFVLFSLLPLLWWDVVAPETKLVLIGLTGLIAAYILATIFVLPRVRLAVRKDLYLVIDILTAASLVYSTGGITSSLLLLLYLPILAAAVRLDLRQTVFSAVAVSAVVMWMWAMAEGGLPSLGSVAVRVALFIIGSLVIAVVFGMLAQETRLSHERRSLNRLLDERLAVATEQLRIRLGELEASYTLARRLAAATDTSVVLQTIAAAACTQLEGPFSAIFLYEQLGGGLSLAHSRGVTAVDVAPVMNACTAWLGADSRDPRTFTLGGDDAIWTRGIYAPIAAGERLIGTVCAGGTDTWQPRAQDEETLRGIADQGGTALERAFLLEDLRRLALANPAAHLFSREQLDRIIREEVQRAAGLGAPFALLKIFIPQLLALSNRPVESAGELLYRRARSIILEAARRIDVVAEGQQGEFFVLMIMTSVGAARKFAVKVRQLLWTDRMSARLQSATAGLDCRIGIAAFPVDGDSGPALYLGAQNALDATGPGHPIVAAGDLTSDASAASVKKEAKKDDVT